MEKSIDVLNKEVEKLKTAFSGLADTVDSIKDSATTNKHVDLHAKTTVSKPPKKIKKEKTKLVEEAEA